MNQLVLTLLAGLLAAVAVVLGHQFSGRYWVAQERWKLRKTYYVRLLRLLADLEDHYAVLEKLEYGPHQKPEHHERYIAAQAKLRDLHDRIRRVKSVADLWIRPEVFAQVQQLRKQIDEHDLERHGVWEGAASVTAVTREAILQIARRDLRLSLKGT